MRDISGLVVKTHSGYYTVQVGGTRLVCHLRGTLKQAAKKTELCVIGDRVLVEFTETDMLSGEQRGVITRILPRERLLSRVEPSAYAGKSTEREQIIIANPDQAVFVFAAQQPEPNTRLVDRFLVAAEKAALPDIALVLNKIDAVSEAHARSLFGIYERIGYPVHYVSALSRVGIEPLRKRLQGKISVFTGPSGVGKSSLLNAIQGGLGQAVGAVSERLTKGKHTTRNAEMFPLEGGGYVADTPGLRSLAPWDVEPGELDAYFPEFRPYIPNCAFNDCTHVHEPGCAVRLALESGKIDPARHDSYCRLRADLESQYIY
ncbi:MAG TPA: ribosome small subunit-dependent GTPase A [Aggregatilineales bacterium]|nr:ribosome small subunit-dependent GTPase A [Anaerolineales bacterium]HRE47029.1 ribosome small subunit-dependent GTPase A [Aggregatilineales bacterium]